MVFKRVNKRIMI